VSGLVAKPCLIDLLGMTSSNESASISAGKKISLGLGLLWNTALCSFFWLFIKTLEMHAFGTLVHILFREVVLQGNILENLNSTAILTLYLGLYNS
jgi:hypothetical protein